MGINRGSNLRPFPVTREGEGVIDGEEGSDKVGPTWQRGRERKRNTGSGSELGGLRAGFCSWAEWFPPGPFSIFFYFLSSFLFCFSLFLS
jgi:hypothetical protein